MPQKNIEVGDLIVGNYYYFVFNVGDPNGDDVSDPEFERIFAEKFIKKYGKSCRYLGKRKIYDRHNDYETIYSFGALNGTIKFLMIEMFGLLLVLNSEDQPLELNINNYSAQNYIFSDLRSDSNDLYILNNPSLLVKIYSA